MRLKDLHIYENYGKEGYRVTASFSGAGGEVKLQVPGDLGDRIVNTCLDQIVGQIREAAAVTAEQILRGPEEAAKEIEHTPAEESRDE